ncbi:MAG: polynucleotide adenylyltransferase PcnB [Thermoanaerobaculia bacterium]|nr:polynucleotide adenylyltransferase PcnB [Thermoanaerobaculia bacterium]MBP9823442.1 polynucleotide adenylyltransferase PcnB [Thermoanaerobaculia bacterium]
MSVSVPPTAASDSIPPRIVARSEHAVSRSRIQKEALKVLYRLQESGYLAYMVGGSVRDLLLGRQPKDFDIATDAKPQEIRRVFRNARIIGRRFRLVHILFGDVVVEVSTFRCEPRLAAPGANSEPELLITSDNSFGTAVEDAFRRDFTVNALFYNIADFSILDYVGGMEDLRQSVLRTIGDPQVRFREDPVRMLRACELAGRLDFTIEAESQAAIHDLRQELTKASPARVSEELVALLRCGSSGKAMQWMLDLGVLEVLLPEAYAMVQASERGLGDFGKILPTLDRKIAAGRQVSDGGLLAALLLPGVLLRRFDIEALARKALRREQLALLVDEVCAPFIKRFALSRVRTQQTTDALKGFLRLCEPHRTAGERHLAVSRSWFPDALWLFELLAEATAEGFEELAQWQAASRRRPVLASGDSLGAPLGGARAAPPRKRPRRRKRR